ncbi:hypothetical protein LJC08_02085 [Methanimicrococcus sp. OttesenSCG-928-J09]|nr:hypothetical protein [Methanimicrococcus sp. OttesenSCG-928-J09]
MATSSYTEPLVIKNKKAIKVLKEVMNTPKSHKDVKVDVFEEIRKCNELM